MLPDVRIDIQDGGLGILAASLEGKQAKVGVCSAGTVNEIIALSDRDQIEAALGTGPLADACFDSFSAGAGIIYAVRADGDVPGSIGAVTATKTGTGNMTAAGTPLDAYQVIVEIVDAGGLNAATFKYSLDGGNTYSQKITVPGAGSYPISGTGITLTFTTAAGTAFENGDQYAFTATAPTASIAAVNAAIDALLYSSYEYEFIHVVGPSDNTLWAALATRAAEAEDKFRYIHFVAEARGPNPGETVDQWVTALVTMRGSFASTRVSVVAGRLELTDGKTGLVVDHNGAGVYCGRVSALKVQESPGKVIVGSLSGVVGLNPAGINEGHITTLDEAGYITFRQYTGLSGFYITNGRIMAEKVSDFQYVELRRPMDKLCRNLRVAALRFEQMEVDPQDPENGFAIMEKWLQSEVDLMASPTVKEISSGTVTIPRDQDILSTSKVMVKIRVVPMGVYRTIELNIGYTNPFRTGGTSE
jgi:hypothetical protein